jgi:hypothetical protein
LFHGEILKKDSFTCFFRNLLSFLFVFLYFRTLMFVFGSFLLSSYYLVFFCVTVYHSLCVGLSFCFFTFIFAYLHSYFQLYCHTCHHALFFRILSNISVLLFGYLSKHEIQRAIFDFGCTRWICLRAFSPWAPSLYLSLSLSPANMMWTQTRCIEQRKEKNNEEKLRTKEDFKTSPPVKFHPPGKTKKKFATRDTRRGWGHSSADFFFIHFFSLKTSRRFSIIYFGGTHH